MIWIYGASISVFFLLGYIFSRDKYARFFHPDLWVNLGTGLAIAVSIRPVMAWLKPSFTLGLIDLHFSNPVLQFHFAFVLIDFSRYWLHYMHHRMPFFWQFHRVHHSSEHLDSTSGLRMHVFDFIQLALIPILWFGLIFDISTWSEYSLAAALSMGVLFDAFQHSSMLFPIDESPYKAWNGLFNNPHFHAWHHVKDAKLCDGNYGNVLLIWDRLFSTEVTQIELPEEYGITEQQALKNDPLSLQLLRQKDPIR